MEINISTFPLSYLTLDQLTWPFIQNPPLAQASLPCCLPDFLCVIPRDSASVSRRFPLFPLPAFGTGLSPVPWAHLPHSHGRPWRGHLCLETRRVPDPKGSCVGYGCWAAHQEGHLCSSASRLPGPSPKPKSSWMDQELSSQQAHRVLELQFTQN